MARTPKVSEPNYKHSNRKVNRRTAESMKKMVSKGYSLSAIATKYDVSPYTVKYNTNEAFRAAELKR